MEVKAEIQVLIDSIFTSWIHMPVQENVLVEECKKMGINLDNPNYKLECCSYYFMVGKLNLPNCNFNNYDRYSILELNELLNKFEALSEEELEKLMNQNKSLLEALKGD